MKVLKKLVDWICTALLFILELPDRMLQKQLDDLIAKHPNFEREAERAVRADRHQGGRRNIHRVLDKYGVADNRWFK